MAIHYDETARTITLYTANTAYQLKIHPLGYLLHAYYGARVDGQDFSYLSPEVEYAFSPNPTGAGRAFSLDAQPLEYPGGGVGDYRVPALEAQNADGSRAADLRYTRHEIAPGKYALDGLPAFFAGDNDAAATLAVWLADAATGLEVRLLYGVFEDTDVITRAAVVTNRSGGDIRLSKAQSASVDFPHGDFDLIHFHGRHAMERAFERLPVMNGVMRVGSGRGASSHQHNPGFILCEQGANEEYGRCYGFNLVYSGSFRAFVERSQTAATRVSWGLGDDGFSWLLAPGEAFTAPEAVMTFSGGGFARMSHNFHKAVNRNLCRSRFANAPRPTLLNNWEGTYFDFDGEKLRSIARAAADIGVDMFVLDDGWFGDRRDDKRALGDWTPNEAKLGGTLAELANDVNAMGLKFGLWFEPEMVSEDSALYRAHPDWALKTPGRQPLVSRSQLVLDLSRADVRAHLYDAVSNVLDSAHIEYVKWDMNRSIADRCSATLPIQRQDELPHRYMLGLYELLGRLTAAHPDVLFEGCSGGGGRFDLGMLAYCPQIWTSDNTDPAARLKIQYGTSFFYPVSSMAAHVSASPNHQTGRVSPFDMRAAAAMCGAFGFELDPAQMSEADKTAAREALARYRANEPLIREGAYYRLESPYCAEGHAIWAHVSADGKTALVRIVAPEPRANLPLTHFRLKGLLPDAVYVCQGRRATGAALMEAGVAAPRPYGHEAAAAFTFAAEG